MEKIFLLHYDGMYRSKEIWETGAYGNGSYTRQHWEDDAEPIFHYLKFVSESHFMYVFSSGDPTEVFRFFFPREFPYYEYSLQGKLIKLNLHGLRRGEVVNDGLIIADLGGYLDWINTEDFEARFIDYIITKIETGEVLDGGDTKFPYFSRHYNRLVPILDSYDNATSRELRGILETQSNLKLKNNMNIRL